jgi:DnaK suppressor protein
MAPEQVEQFRKQLLTLRDTLIEALAINKNEVKPVILDQAAVGRVSRGDAMQVQQMALESSRRRERQLISVKQALARLEKEDYGMCTDCDEAINIRRLEIDPTAIRCINCAEAHSQ